MVSPKSTIDPIVQLVNQNSSRYSLNRPINSIVNYDGVNLYSFPWTASIDSGEGDKYIYYTINNRLDQLANEYYGDPKLWWIIAQVNDINDPLIDLEIGMMLRIPPLTSIIQNGVAR